MTHIPEPNAGQQVVAEETRLFTPFWYRFMADVFTSLGGGTGAVRVVGEGTPEGVIIADRGSTYHRTDGGAGTCLYIKESGDGTATGWVGK